MIRLIGADLRIGWMSGFAQEASDIKDAWPAILPEPSTTLWIAFDAPNAFSPLSAVPSAVGIVIMAGTFAQLLSSGGVGVSMKWSMFGDRAGCAGAAGLIPNAGADESLSLLSKGSFEPEKWLPSELISGVRKDSVVGTPPGSGEAIPRERNEGRRRF